jgi:hypothetical protein
MFNSHAGIDFISIFYFYPFNITATGNPLLYQVPFMSGHPRAGKIAQHGSVVRARCQTPNTRIFFLKQKNFLYHFLEHVNTFFFLKPSSEAHT